LLSCSFEKEKSKLWSMDSLHLICPHCGLKMEVFLKGKPSSIMVFVCARCHEPLMRYEGEVFELDREEFGMLRKKLAPVIAELMNESYVSNPAVVSSTLTVANAKVEPQKVSTSISEETLLALTKNLEECRDVAEFLEKM
jgi:DNA-directed RNA polymerase subunit RPC12/RpoP